jgi:hypothetical protein
MIALAMEDTFMVSCIAVLECLLMRFCYNLLISSVEDLPLYLSLVELKL